ncbi:long-chain fatty acid--CoA ligase [Spongiibacter sp. KMU-166]|uniref:Long-chain fatty acid--CoA ligase n=1 Tax=Spongiibacter thalassae TaxID=2721624 RepID=A0ABX1GBV7_9GAMM|nr:fatty acid--CoA ligase family protein [Spongiibacter thalassae]NKI15982.1 long-chain fatty acid--CoA ligase [Spongiibacter thalassae]
MNISSQIKQSLTDARLSNALEYQGNWFSWQDLSRHAGSLQQVLGHAGLGEGARVALVARNRPAHVAALLGLMASRYTTAMVYVAQPEQELAAELVNMAVPAVIADAEDWTPGLISAVKAAGVMGLSVSGRLPSGLQVEKICDLTNLSLALVGQSETAIEMLSSGTTGKPKRIAISYTTLDKAAAGMVKVGDAAPTVDILPFPIGNISGLYFLIPACLNQQALVLLEKFRLDDWLRAVKAYRPSYCAVPPPAIKMILDRKVAKEDLQGLAALGVGASPLDPEVQKTFQDYYGISILIGYGATEFGGVIVAWTLEEHQLFGDVKLGSVGRVREGVEIRIIDSESGHPLPFGEVGILEAKVDRIGSEWLRTTDLAMMDSEGFVFIKGRADDTINRGGFKVQPEKVEAVLRRHKSVSEVAVVGQRDDRLGQIPVAVIELKEGLSPPSSAELEDLARQVLRPQEVPARFLTFKELPRTASLKVRRKEVRERLGEAGELG